MKAVANLPVRKIRVILADDHPVVRDGLAAIVNQQADMQVVAEAGDGAEALELYEQHQPDVMVLDLRMPKLDGAAVVQKVLEKHPKACLLIMTTYDGDEDIFRSLSQGAKGYRSRTRHARKSVRHPRGGRRPALHLVDHRRQGAAAHVASQPHDARTRRVAARGPRPSNKDIARRLEITEGTQRPTKAILEARCISRTEAVAVAHKRGLIRLS
jgi:two-component system NarL family response regulator